uniref:FAD-binding PCMH-type domain-containing protein n=1 Tax=Salix viminalis TaxID=40686 RepID=A0A6N2KKE7_SALVM
MNSLIPSILSFLSIFLLICFSWVTSAHTHEDFLQCLYNKNSNSISKVIYTPINSSYPSVLQFSIRNLRFNTTATPKPLVIVTPVNVSQIQDSVICSKKTGLQIRVRSGGHDFEGLSYVSMSPFVLVDLINSRTINVDVSPTVGVGGHISGGGSGMILRKFGLAADHITDAVLVDAEGRIHDRKSMGEDLFWAIRGGGGNTFGIVVAWKINLVPVPPTVTGFNVSRTLEQNATKLVHRWQYVSNKLQNRYFHQNFPKESRRASFIDARDFSSIDCIEMSWIESVLYFAGFPSNTSLDVLLDRTPTSDAFYKIKSDYVKEPLPEIALEGIWKRMDQLEMDEISESSLSFPHRAGIIYQIEYLVLVEEESSEASRRYISWIRSLLDYMTPYVSKNPRQVYVNYRDLDLGINNLAGNTSYKSKHLADIQNNFDRLVRVKSAVDPGNFFRHERSILSLSSW